MWHFSGEFWPYVTFFHLDDELTQQHVFYTCTVPLLLSFYCNQQMRVFGPKRDDVTGEWIKLHNEELSDLYSLPSIEQVVKLRRMRWAGHVARMGEGRGVHRVLVGKPEGRNHWGDPDIDGRITLRRTFRKWEGVLENGWSWLRIGTGGGHL